MQRRDFIGKTLAGSVLAPAIAHAAGQEENRKQPAPDLTQRGRVIVERAVPGRPHAGQV